MDPTRISIARVLALDVPLSWQDAVAIMREVAVLAEMNAAWNDQPSVVSADRCFLTADGAVELPDTAERESPDDLRALLELLLRGRQAPDDVASLGRRHGRADLSGALTAVAVGDRRRLIADVVARAIAAAAGPPVSAAAPTPAMPAAPAPIAAAEPATPAPVEPPPAEPDDTSQVAPPPPVPPRPVVVPLRSTRATAEVPVYAPPPERETAPDTDPPADDVAPPIAAAAARTAPAMPRVIRPPFVAAPAPQGRTAEVRTLGADIGAGEPASRELERLRMKTATATPPATPMLRRLLPWIYYRPDGVDPRLIGGAALVLAATVALIIGSAPKPAPPARPAPQPPDDVRPTVVASGGPAAPVPFNSRGAATVPSPGVAAGFGGDGVPARPITGQPAASGGAATGVPAPPAPATPPLSAATSARTTRRAEVTTATPAGATPTSAGTAPPSASTTPSPVSTWVEGAGRPETRAEGRRRDRDPDGRALEAADASLSRWLPPSRAPLYSAGDSGVTPPVMRRQQLPSMLLEPRAEVPADWPFLELVVDERGAVEAVRLRAVTVAPGQTLYRHRMLLAAAKAWQFDPATRDGVPVRFLMRVPLEP